MPATPFQLHLPQPCQQSWDAMTPAGAGRHCTACQQVVIDFTAFTDGELAAYLAQPGKLPCGRFRASQLNRVLLPAAAPVAGWRRWLGAAVALLGLGSLATPARAQQGTPAHPATAQPAGAGQLLGRPARPAATQAACSPPAQASVPMLLGEPMLAGAPQRLPAHPAKATRKKK